MAKKEIKYTQVLDYYPRLKNPEKYTGVRPLTLRSSYEIRFVKHFLDNNKKVIEWTCEDVVIPYYYRVDKKYHRYFVDFWMKVQESVDVVKEYLIEVKPSNKIPQPKRQKRNTERYKKRMAEWIKNQDKWKFAKKWCRQLREEKGIDISFKIITEKELGIKK